MQSCELYRKLDIKEGENDTYKMTKFCRKKKIRNFNQVKYIKDEADRFLMNDDDIKNRLREYFDKLFNYESEKIATELDEQVICSENSRV
jgi:hypothetical protein